MSYNFRTRKILRFFYFILSLICGLGSSGLANKKKTYQILSYFSNCCLNILKKLDSATRSEQIRAAQFQNNPQAQTTDTGMVDSQEKTNQKNFPSNLNDDPVTYTKGLYVLLKSRREIAISSLKK